MFKLKLLCKIHSQTVSSITLSLPQSLMSLFMVCKRNSYCSFHFISLTLATLAYVRHEFQFCFRAWINFNKHTNQIWCVIWIYHSNQMCINWSLEIINWWDLNENSCALLMNHDCCGRKNFHLLLYYSITTYVHSHTTLLNQMNECKKF